MLPLPFPKQHSGRVLDIPKSQILTYESLLIKMLLGFMSLWTTLAECKYFRAQRVLYIIIIRCSSVYPLFGPSLMSALRSVSNFSMTTKRTMLP